MKDLKHKNHLNISVKNQELENYLFIQVWDNSKIKDSKIQEPVAWLAPVWISK